MYSNIWNNYVDFWLFKMTFHNLQNSLIYRLKTQEIAFQRFGISKFSRGQAPGKLFFRVPPLLSSIEWSAPQFENPGDATAHLRQRVNRYGRDAKETRIKFEEYFNSEEGSVPWQLKYVRSCGESFAHALYYKRKN